MRAVAGEAALEVRRRVLGELGGEGRRVAARASAAGSAARPRSPRPSASAIAVKRGGEQVDRGGAIVAQRDAVAGELGVPRRQRARASARPLRTRASSALRWASACAVRAARRRAARPHRGDDLVDVRAAQRRRPLDELEAVGQEHADRAAATATSMRSTRDAVGLHALRLAGRRSRRSARAPRPRRRAGRPRRGRRAASKRTTSRSLDVRHERPGAAEVQRLEEVRLAGAVAAVHDGEAVAERDVRGARSCGSRAASGGWRSSRGGRRRLDVQADRHDEVEEAAAVRRLDEARPQRADELEDEVAALRRSRGRRAGTPG